MKYAENGKDEKACQSALQQISGRQYASALKQDGIETIHLYAVACYKKAAAYYPQNSNREPSLPVLLLIIPRRKTVGLLKLPRKISVIRIPHLRGNHADGIAAVL